MTDTRLSACVEWLFAEGHPPISDRVRRAAAAGCDGIEFWTWRDKALDAIAEAIAETGVAAVMMNVEPRSRLVDPARRSEFLTGVRDSAEAASRIRCGALVALSGDLRAGVSKTDQDQAIVTSLREAAPIVRDFGLKLLLEPLNTRRDHPGTYLSDTSLGLELVERVDRPEVALLYDVYHSAMMGEQISDVLAGRASLVGHVHVADTQGRHEPGTGTIDWAQTISFLQSAGYRGFFGLEYEPTVDSAASIEVARQAIVFKAGP